MKWRTILLCAVAAVVVAFVLAGCGEPPEKSWTYVGTWVNSTYNGHAGAGNPGKVVFTASSEAIYNNDTDITPLGTYPMTFAEDWTSGGDHYFKGTVMISSNTLYFLIRVSNNNNTLEGNTTDTSYPAVIDPAASNYGIFARQ
jgi:hypothetical protein